MFRSFCLLLLGTLFLTACSPNCPPNDRELALWPDFVSFINSESLRSDDSAFVVAVERELEGCQEPGAACLDPFLSALAESSPAGASSYYFELDRRVQPEADTRSALMERWEATLQVVRIVAKERLEDQKMSCWELATDSLTGVLHVSVPQAEVDGAGKLLAANGQVRFLPGVSLYNMMDRLAVMDSIVYANGWLPVDSTPPAIESDLSAGGIFRAIGIGRAGRRHDRVPGI